MAAIIEITLEQLRTDSDWAQVFADEDAGNVSKHVQEVPPGADVSNTSDGVSRDDVAEIIAAVNGENDGDDWVGVFLLKDGRYLRASGGCDYTGWDCRAGNSLCVAATLADIVKYGLPDKEKKRLGLLGDGN
jgi:hypothetical protein